MTSWTATRIALTAAAVAIAVFVVLGAAAGLAVVYAGVYSVAATVQHFAPTFKALDIGLRRSVEHHARDLAVPPLDGEGRMQRGFACFKQHCEQCHGAPGTPQAEFAKGLLPVPSSLSQASHDWPPAQLYWLTRNGIKMTGMPAWEYRLDDDALWSIVALLTQLPLLTPDAYRAWSARSGEGCERREARDAVAMPPDAERGKVVILQYACTACHRIPGVVGPASHTGPPLDAMSRRKYIAGVLPNTTGNMVRWLREPQAVNPHTAMPDLGLTEAHARDIAAYLAQLK